jgi:hypothetical protein
VPEHVPEDKLHPTSVVQVAAEFALHGWTVPVQLPCQVHAPVGHETSVVCAEQSVKQTRLRLSQVQAPVQLAWGRPEHGSAPEALQVPTVVLRLQPRQ